MNQPTFNSVFTRSGVNGTCRNRTPVASKTALPIAAAVTVIDTSPAPFASASIALTHPRGDRRRLGELRSGGGRHRRGRDHQPARDDRGLGPRDRPPRLQRDRLAGRAHRRACRELRRRGTDQLREAHRPAASHLLLRPEDRAGSSTTSTARASGPRPASSPSARSTPGCCGTSPAATAHVTDVTNAVAHAADGPRDARLGRRAARLLGIPRRCCRRSGPSSEATARPRAPRSAASRSPASSATSRPRCSARPASTPATPRTPTAPAASCS